MSITYTTGIPDPTHNPSVDAPNMQTNTNSIDSWNSIDHFTFSSLNAGKHKYIQLPANSTPPSPGGLAASAYTAPGTADASQSQLYYANSSITVPLSIVKAFGVISTSGPTLTNGFNVASIGTAGTGIYQITMTTPLAGTGYAVIATPVVVSGGGYPNITISYLNFSSTQFRLYTQNTQSSVGIAVPGFSFIVLQV